MSHLSLASVWQDLFWNLDVIGKLKHHETLCVNGDRLDVDTRTCQSLRRFMFHDSRMQILLVIQKTLQKIAEILRVYEILMNFFKSKNASNNQNKPACSCQHLEPDGVLDMIQEFISRKESTLQGLQMLQTFERYTSDTNFQIPMSNALKQFTQLQEQASHLLPSV